MKYCFVAGNYPTEKRQVHVFLENIVVRLVDRKEKCYVIAPQSIYAYFFKKENRRKIIDKRITKNNETYMVYSPLYFVFPKIKIGSFSTINWSNYMFYRALKRVYKKYKIDADVIYSHFFQAGIPGVRLAQYYKLPSFIANGEADTIDSLKLNSKKNVTKTLNNVTGIISVSTKNKNEVKELCNNNREIMNKVTVIINAVDSKRFHLMNKEEARERLGWPKDKFIIAFTGSFIERKGFYKLNNVLNKMDDVYSAFMGVGEDKPNCKNLLFSGRVNNNELGIYLNAADAFVLPTQAEGCSNAIVEAVCCGLPIISSDLEFNYDFLNENCAILIDPNSEEEIKNAIETLKNDKILREKLHEGSIKKSSQLSLDVRVDKIVEFIQSRL